ncbi:hypothetical protein G7054_g1252 [Neopestalotiopsis clavispora]|nr:hypothetical protein G7054_g1252 [Neopestalotiopsis clavispora]
MAVTKSSALLLLAASQQWALALAQDLSSTIVGCNDVACPQKNGYDECTVTDDVFVGVGLTRIPGLPDSFEGLSIVKGVNVSAAGPTAESNGTDRQYRSVYYLGAPEGQDLDGLEGCAIFFPHDGGRQFDGSKRSSNQGTCQDIYEPTCIDDLTQEALALWENSTATGDDRCTSVRDALAEADLPSCVDFTGDGQGLGSDFTVQSLSGLSPITGDQNSSSDCWPITPKTDNLFEISEDTALNGYNASNFDDEVYKISRVLTLLSSSTNDTSSQLTCVKVVAKEVAEDTAKNAATANTYSLLGFGTAMAVSLLLL